MPIMNMVDAAARFARQLLKSELPSEYTYHSLRHTHDVRCGVKLFAKYQELSPADTMLLSTAAAFHDTGYIRCSNNHEQHSADIAGEVLPKFNFTIQQIKQIQQLILATRLPYAPKNMLECIMCDADVEYLGRPEFYELSYLFRVELKAHCNKNYTEEEWLMFEIKFLRHLQFFSPAGKALREPGKLRNLAQLEHLYYILTGERI